MLIVLGFNDCLRSSRTMMCVHGIYAHCINRAVNPDLSRQSPQREHWVFLITSDAFRVLSPGHFKLRRDCMDRENLSRAPQLSAGNHKSPDGAATEDGNRRRQPYLLP